MKTISSFAHAIVVDDDVGIIMEDGCRLSARLWLPDDAHTHPVPVIIEHLPYRKRDGTIARDEMMHPWFAGHGYACLRTDMRGNGDSDGLMDDEYTWQEWQDACAVIDWATAQPWCSGRAGMMGISWGGFNALQVAALRPPALEAIITVCSTVDRFADDIHYKGGCLLTENIAWAANMMSYSSRPPDKAIVGDRWKPLWLQRLDNLPFLASTWHRHQHRDDYWKHGSVCENYEAIKAAVLSVGGWHDGYRNTPSHLVTHLQVPVKGIVGPWNHKYPHYAAPQPAIGFLQEAKRWWDRWLKDEATGVEDDPAYRVWLMNSVEPSRSLSMRPGRWIAESEWPSGAISTQVLHLYDGALTREAPTRDIEVRICSRQDCGRASGEYFPFAFGPELPDEQSIDDQQSAVFDSVTLSEAMDIVGAPEIRLRLQADSPSGLVCVRLCDVRADGKSALITSGLLNLRHRNDPEHPCDLIPGSAVTLRFLLDQIAYRIPAGHRLRIAISTAYWPFVWPGAQITTLTLLSGSLGLPQRQSVGAGLETTDEVCFELPEAAPGWQSECLRSPCSSRKTFEEPHSGKTITEIVNDFGEYRDRHHGLLSGSITNETWSIDPDDPLSAEALITWHQTGGRDQWQWATEVTVTMQCSADTFRIQAMVRAFENQLEIFSRTDTDVIARDFV